MNLLAAARAGNNRAQSWRCIKLSNLSRKNIKISIAHAKMSAGRANAPILGETPAVNQDLKTTISLGQRRVSIFGMQSNRAMHAKEIFSKARAPTGRHGRADPIRSQWRIAKRQSGRARRVPMLLSELVARATAHREWPGQ